MYLLAKRKGRKSTVACYLKYGVMFLLIMPISTGLLWHLCNIYIYDIYVYVFMFDIHLWDLWHLCVTPHYCDILTLSVIMSVLQHFYCDEVILANNLPISTWKCIVASYQACFQIYNAPGKCNALLSPLLPLSIFYGNVWLPFHLQLIISDY